MMIDSVLITGGTGFFGHACVKQLLNTTGISRICIYSRDEHKQAVMRAHFDDNERLRWFIGDVRDAGRLKRAMNGVDLVLHAAALKRIEVGAYNPDEMLKTNVHGAMNVIDAASDAGVKKVVALSTDKAYQPVSPYGFSKAMAESLFICANDTHPSTKFSVVRYGNIAGSTGSIIPKWRSLLANGAQVVPVSDPTCTRFWMTGQQAVTLVLKTAGTMRGGELAIPILPAYSVGDLAKAMDAKTNVTGLGSWEKRHESMDAKNCSETARRMSVDEIREALSHV